MNNQELIKRDLNVVWHPCSQMKDYETYPLIPIKYGQAEWLYDFDGNRYLDAISSWWVNIFGHANPEINQAISTQLQSLEHVIMAGFTHEPIVALSEKLIALTNQQLDYCFYADNGSSCIEVALKMSFHYWKNIGKGKKDKFVTFKNSYHGETVGAMSVGDVALYTETYQSLLFQTYKVEPADLFYKPEEESIESYSKRKFQEMEQLLAERHHEIAAVIIEPLVQCAGGMRMHSPFYLKLLKEACEKYNVHLILDEIAVGFGRTGSFFAHQQADIIPDFLCLSKAITGGYLPMSVCLTHQQIYQAFYDDYHKLSAFLHSHSYTGNALACSAALATLNIFEKQNIIENNQTLIQTFTNEIEPLNAHPNIGDVRQTGMIIALEMVKDKNNKTHFPWQERRGRLVYEYALSKGLLLRPLGDVVYFMPPYIISKEQIKWMVNIAVEGIDYAVKKAL